MPCAEPWTERPYAHAEIFRNLRPALSALKRKPDRLFPKLSRVLLSHCRTPRLSLYCQVPTFSREGLYSTTHADARPSGCRLCRLLIPCPTHLLRTSGPGCSLLPVVSASNPSSLRTSASASALCRCRTSDALRGLSRTFPSRPLDLVFSGWFFTHTRCVHALPPRSCATSFRLLSLSSTVRTASFRKPPLCRLAITGLTYKLSHIA